MNTNRSIFGLACRAAAFSFVMAGSASLLQAQQPSVAPAPQAPLFLASESAPLDLSTLSSTSSSSSSSSSSDAIPSYAKLDFDSSALKSSQPPPRRSYGRPSYSGGNTNPDGSDKWFAIGGFGLTLPVGNTHKYETPSWGLQAGIGRNFNKNVGVDAEFNYDHFGLQGATLANQNYLYGTQGDGLDGNNHVWSFTLEPRYTLATQGSIGAYLVAGGGYYHKVTNFTLPSTGDYCDYYGFCYQYTANEVIDHYTSNAFGINGGVGLTYKFSKFSNEEFYVEARYTLIFNPQRYGVTASTPIATLNSYTGYNYYPQNSNRTTYIPIKFGIRF
jgi:opacity protein-like surface antigen